MNEEEIQRIFTAIDPAAGLDDGGLDSVFNVGELMKRVNEGILANRPIKTGRRWRRFRRGFTVPLAILLIASGTAAAVSLLRSPEPIRLSATMSCYSQPSKHAHLIDVVDLTSTPRQTCERALRSALNAQAAPTFTSAELCVSNDDVLRVFPKSREKNLCDRLGYARFSGKVIVDGVSRLTLQIRDFSLSHLCVSVQVGIADANKFLTSNSLSASWNVSVTSHTPNAPLCATFAIDDVHRIVDVVTVPASVYACGGPDMKVAMDPHVVEGDGRSAYVVRVVNESDVACTLPSYADVTLSGAGSAGPRTVSHAPTGAKGSSPSRNAGKPSPVMSLGRNGGTASFLLEFPGSATSCVIQYQNLSMRLIGDTTVHRLRLPHSTFGCVRPLITDFAQGSRGPSQ